MTSLTTSHVRIGIEPAAAPSMPSWFGEVVAFAHRLTHTGIFTQIEEQVRIARVRFGRYEVIDFVVVLIGSIHAARTDAVSFLTFGWLRGPHHS